MSDSDGISRLRKAADNQASLGEATFMLPVGEVLAMLDEVEAELAQLAWAKGVPAPVDADGRVVPLDTAELYADDGGIIYVSSIRFNGCTWFVSGENSYKLYWLNTLHLVQPDSWALLEKDIFTLAVSKRLADPKGDARECVSRAKAIAERDAKGADRG